jgi:hypothetical protein
LRQQEIQSQIEIFGGNRKGSQCARGHVARIVRFEYPLRASDLLGTQLDWAHDLGLIFEAQCNYGEQRQWQQQEKTDNTPDD